MAGTARPATTRPAARTTAAAGRNAAAAPTDTAAASVPASAGPTRPHVQVLQGVDVGDHAREQVAAAVALELRGRQRLDPRVDGRAHAREDAQRHVVRREPFGVPGERARQAEEADADDRDREREDRGLLAPRGRSGSPPSPSARRRSRS